MRAFGLTPLSFLSILRDVSVMNLKKLKKLARRIPDISVPQSVEFITLLAAAERANDLTGQDVKELKFDLGQAFRRMRERARLSRKQFCERTGISDAQLTMLESGRAGMTAYAPALFALSLHGTENMLEEASQMEARWEPELSPNEAK